MSAGASSDLLYDYEEPVRSQILDLLFKPKFGAAFQHLKVEMGGGENAGCGSEASHAIKPDELQNPVSRGYEFWLMREAKDRNLDMILEYLPWRFPYWLSWRFTHNSADYFVAFLEVAKKQWDLDIDWVAASENENGTDRDWIVNKLRPALDARGYKEVKIQAPDDDSGDWKIIEEMADDPAYREIIKAVGYHYVSGRNFTEAMVEDRGRPTTALARHSGIPLWASEDWSWTGKEWGGAGALTLARLYNKFYVRDRITKTLIWAPIGSVYESVVWDKAGAMRANRPWSGYYEVWPAIWATAHTTQFAEPHSWRYLDSGCGLFDANTYKGSCVTLRDKHSPNWSMVLCTETSEAIHVEIKEGLSTGTVYVWKSDEQTQFVQQENIIPVDGAFSIKLDSRCIYSLTTTTGQQKGHYEIPEDTPFPFPYKENYEDRKVGDLPKYHSDQKGSFEIALRQDGTQCLKQIVPEEGYRWLALIRRKHVKPHTLIGDVNWRNYTCNVDVFLTNGNVELGGCVQGGYLRGYRIILTEEGDWTLVFDKKSLATGSIADFDRNAWHKLRLRFREKQVEAFVDENLVAKVAHKQHKGYVSLASSYGENLFDNLEVTPY